MAALTITTSAPDMEAWPRPTEAQASGSTAVPTARRPARTSVPAAPAGGALSVQNSWMVSVVVANRVSQPSKVVDAPATSSVQVASGASCGGGSEGAVGCEQARAGGGDNAAVMSWLRGGGR